MPFEPLTESTNIRLRLDTIETEPALCVCITLRKPVHTPVVSNAGSTGKAGALLRVVGWFCLALGAAASAILIGDRLFDIAPPGCGPESACARLSRGPWSVVGPWKVPLSFVGLACFLTSATIWLRSRGGVSWAARVWSLAGIFPRETGRGGQCFLAEPG